MKNKMNTQLGIVEVVEDHERCASDWIHAKSQVGMRPFDCRKCRQDMFDDGIDAVALLSDDTHTKRLDALSEESVELIEGCLETRTFLMSATGEPRAWREIDQSARGLRRENMIGQL